MAYRSQYPLRRREVKYAFRRNSPSLLVGITSVGFGGGGLKDLPASGKDYDAVTGREIYSNTCIRCHGIDGKNDGAPACSKAGRPDITGYPEPVGCQPLQT